MVKYDISSLFEIPLIDVSATSNNLKLLREKRNITVAEIQQLLGMEYPQIFAKSLNEKLNGKTQNLCSR